MRIEPPKTHNSDQSNQPAKSAENVFRTVPNNTQLNNPPAPSSGAFEKIMSETRNSAKDDAVSAKTENNSESNETSETKKSGEKEIAGKEDLRDRQENKGGESQNGEQNENPALLNSPGVFSNGNSTSEIPLPAARSILHVADLERIISTLRTFETKIPGKFLSL